MFKQLEALLKNCSSLNLILAANKDGTLSVTVLPKPSKTGDDAATLSTPLSLTATAEQLDAEFVTLLSSYVGTHQSLAEQIENTNAILEAAKKESQKKATTAISKSSTKSAEPAKPAAEASGGDGGSDIEDEEDHDGNGIESTGGDTNTGGTVSTGNIPPAAKAEEPANLWG